ncbi:MAG: tetratricopeptide repeat protein [Lachnospiraceae bacterium]|nr:tetratricopeptide repeat protein [Lachnospiraceae bacterium]
MNCPNCGAPVPSKKMVCDSCGADLTVYKKIIRLSNVYYNKGLEKAKVRNLSGAIDDLQRSLQINKKNTDARNLLGLVYFETGEVVQALSEWVISKNLQPHENEADDLLQKVQDNPVELDTLNQAVKKYNQAVNALHEYSDERNDDMAILQLRKAVSMHGNFLKALQLLGLLLLKNREYDKALKYLNRAKEIDVSNPITLRYIAQIEEETYSPDKKNKNEKNGRQNSDITGSEDAGRSQKFFGLSGSYKEEKPNVMVFINLLIGVLIGIAVVYYLVIPTKESKIREEYDARKVDYSAEISSKTALITQHESTIASLNRRIDELETQLANVPTEPEIITVGNDMYDGLFEAWNEYNKLRGTDYSDDELVRVAMQLVAIDENGIENEYAKLLLADMRDYVYSRAARKVYRSGKNAFDGGDYAEAAEKLEAAVALSPENDAAMYYLGKAYQALNELEKAVYYYKLMLEVCPNSTLKEYIPQRLRECGVTE